MVISLPQNHPKRYRPADKYVVPVLPSDVEQYIRMGLQAGWRPDQPGKQFLLSIPANN